MSKLASFKDELVVQVLCPHFFSLRLSYKQPKSASNYIMACEKGSAVFGFMHKL